MWGKVGVSGWVGWGGAPSTAGVGEALAGNEAVLKRLTGLRQHNRCSPEPRSRRQGHAFVRPACPPPAHHLLPAPQAAGRVARRLVRGGAGGPQLLGGAVQPARAQPGEHRAGARCHPAGKAGRRRAAVAPAAAAPAAWRPTAADALEHGCRPMRGEYRPRELSMYSCPVLTHNTHACLA